MTLQANKFEMFLARLLGRKCERVVDGYYVCFYTWRGVIYIDKVEEA